MDVLLFSGGIESTCLAYMLQPAVCLTIDYGQVVANGEIRAARDIANYFGLTHSILEVDLSQLGSGQMAGKAAIVDARIPEFWPFRNQLLITLAAMKFVNNLNVQIVIGSVKNDSSHKDGTSEFVERMKVILSMQEGGVDLGAPAIHLDSFELIRASRIPVDVLDMTFSCFQSEFPCGQCRGCMKNESLRSAYYGESQSCS
jgi:7-cyano-7-deazaguanine synthase